MSITIQLQPVVPAIVLQVNQQNAIVVPVVVPDPISAAIAEDVPADITVVPAEAQINIDFGAPTDIPQSITDATLALLGGTQDQVLVKLSSLAYDYEWQDMQINQPEYTKLIDEVNESTMYIGEAQPGTLQSQSLWRIKRVQQTNEDLEITFANASNTFGFVWNNRLAYSYSV